MKIALIGDIAFTGILSTQPEMNQRRYKAVIPLLQSVGFVFANLEVPIKVDEARNEYKNAIHYSLPEPTHDLLKLLNIGCVSLANNHIYDCKMSGLKATINILDRLGIHHTGAGWRPDHITPAVIEKDGYRIGFLAYVDKSTNPRTENFSELLINYFDPETVKKDIRALRSRVDKIIVSVHWGIDYSFYPTPSQRAIAQELIDAGADILMGHHPHTLQPYEKYNNGYIFYSLGGLTFGDYIKEGKTELQALFRKTKYSVIVKNDIRNGSFDFFSTRELEGNHLRVASRDYRKWTMWKWRFFSIKHYRPVFGYVFDVKEKVFDRVFEYFFGYYKNPIKRLFQFGNLRKIKRLFIGISQKS